jgi:Fe-S cluster assembly protein SufD
LASNPTPVPTALEAVGLGDVTAISRAAGERAELAEVRRRARALLAGTVLPHRALHLWRYTDPSAFVPLTDPAAMTPAPVTGEWRLDEDLAGSALLAGGALRRVELSEEARGAGVEFIDLHAAGAADAARLGEAVPASHGFVEAVNLAAWRGGVVLRVPPRVHLKKALRIRIVGPSAGAVSLPRVLVLAGEESSFQVIEGHGAGDAQRAQVLGVSEILVGAGADVRYDLVQRWEPGVIGHHTAYARLGAGARFTMATAQFGGDTVKTDVGAILDGEGANSEIYGVAMGGERQRIDQHTEHLHLASHTQSNLDVKVALTDAARSAYTGVIRIAEDARECEAYQENRNLLLSGDARAESIPELEILNQDVRCTHGATVAPLDEEQLFYLSSRGLARSQAMRLIVYGFLDQTLQRLPESTRSRIQAMVAARLHAD